MNDPLDIARRPELSYTVIEIDGALQTIPISQAFRWDGATWDQLRGIIGGWVSSPVRLQSNDIFDPDIFIMLADDDGLPKHREPNLGASLLAGQTLVGTVVVTPKWTLE